MEDIEGKLTRQITILDKPGAHWPLRLNRSKRRSQTMRSLSNTLGMTITWENLRSNCATLRSCFREMLPSLVHAGQRQRN